MTDDAGGGGAKDAEGDGDGGLMFVNYTPGQKKPTNKAPRQFIRRHVMNNYLSKTQRPETQPTTSRSHAGKNAVNVRHAPSRTPAKAKKTRGKKEPDQHTSDMDVPELSPSSTTSLMMSHSPPTPRSPLNRQGHLIDPFVALPFQSGKATTDALRWHFYSPLEGGLSPWLRAIGHAYRNLMWDMAMEDVAAFHTLAWGAAFKRGRATGEPVNATCLFHKGQALRAMKEIIEVKGVSTSSIRPLFTAILSTALYAVQEADFHAARAHMDAIEMIRAKYNFNTDTQTGTIECMALWLTDLQVASLGLDMPRLTYSLPSLRVLYADASRYMQNLGATASEEASQIVLVLPFMETAEATAAFETFRALKLYSAALRAGMVEPRSLIRMMYSLGHALVIAMTEVERRTRDSTDYFTPADAVVICANVTFWTLLGAFTPAVPIYNILLPRLYRHLKWRDNLILWWQRSTNGSIEALLWVLHTANAAASLTEAPQPPQAQGIGKYTQRQWFQWRLDEIVIVMGLHTEVELHDALHRWPAADICGGRQCATFGISDGQAVQEYIPVVVRDGPVPETER